MNPAIFKAYDVRGVYPDEFDASAAAAIGGAFVAYLGSGKTIAVGRDVRESGQELFDAFARGVVAAGAQVIDIGMCTTEMLYFAVAHYGYDGGVMVSASHNERQYNGLKFVREGARPISMDSGLADIRDRAMALVSSPVSRGSERGLSGGVAAKDIWNDYLDKILTFVDRERIRPFHIVANANFGMAGRVLTRLIEHGQLPVTITPLDFEPDGTFPKGKPDPLIEERRKETILRIRSVQPDFGVAWDADADRVFFFDERGGFVEGYYTLSILARHLLHEHKGARIIYDPRQTWATIDTVSAAGGEAIVSKAGHSFIKERMRKEGALFAGENSGHYYFRDYYGVDSGMIPFLMMLSILSSSQRPLSAIADEFRKQYPTSGEINRRVGDPDAVLARVANEYRDGTVEHIDGLSVEYPEWRFNLRKSNTEPVIRLNVEAKTESLLKERTDALLARIEAISK